MTCQLRRLRLHGLITRVAGSHRYRVTDEGLRIALLFTHTYGRILRPSLSGILPEAVPGEAPRRQQFNQLDATIEQSINRAKLAV
jgi:hypothetical protein